MVISHRGLFFVFFNPGYDIPGKLGGNKLLQDKKKKDDLIEKTGKEVTIYDIYQRCLVIRLNEELDHHNALGIREKADKMIDRNHIKDIVFDFSGAGFMDSAGIGVIMGRYKKVIFIGGKTAVTNVNSTVDRVFRLSGLYKIIDKYDSVEAALSSLHEG